MRKTLARVWEWIKTYGLIILAFGVLVTAGFMAFILIIFKAENSLLLGWMGPLSIAVLLWCIWVLRTATKLRRRKLEAAEKRAFGGFDDKWHIDVDIDEASVLAQRQWPIKSEGGTAKPLGGTKGENPLSLPALYQLYTEQIKAYQDEARSRASLSFFFAIVAMFAGFGFVGWGGYHCIAGNNVTAGASLAGIGGAISAFLTATFLKMYRISIEQLHVYFQQPVINDNVVNAQRIAELVEDKTRRDQMYEEIARKLLSRVEVKSPDDKAKR